MTLQKSASRTKRTQSKAKRTISTGRSGQDAISLLKADHRTVEGLFNRFSAASSSKQKRDIIEKICKELVIHAGIEEEIFYPACRAFGVTEDNMDEALVEHDTLKVLVRDLLGETPDSPYYDAKATVLFEYVKHHVKEEEKPTDGIFAKAKKQGLDLADIGRQLKEHKSALKAEIEARGITMPSLVTLNLGATPSTRSGRQESRPRREVNSGSYGERRYGGDGRARSYFRSTSGGGHFSG